MIYEDFLKDVIEEIYDGVPEFMDANQWELMEMLQNGSTMISINGQEYKLSLTVTEVLCGSTL